jgi:hypothetical protein
VVALVAEWVLGKRRTAADTAYYERVKAQGA